MVVAAIHNIVLMAYKTLQPLSAIDTILRMMILAIIIGNIASVAESVELWYGGGMLA